MLPPRPLARNPCCTSNLHRGEPGQHLDHAGQRDLAGAQNLGMIAESQGLRHVGFILGCQNGSMRRSRSTLLRRALWALLALAILIQLVPYGHGQSNPPVRQEPAWDHPRTRDLAVRACFDCHSNQVRWPWYSRIAPVSWLVQYDVDEARHELNFSEWDRPQEEAHEAAEEVAEGEMPLPLYLVTHPTARLSAAERQELIRGLEATLGGIDESEDSDD